MVDKDLLTIAILGLIGIGLTAARRIRNEDAHAGYGVAGWTFFIILLYVLGR